jgi:N-acetylglucosamine-6-phosphate deacetylase
VSDQTAVVGGRVASSSGLEEAAVTICDGVIASVGPRPDTGGRVVDATGLLVAPGYMDLQCNGSYGIDLAREPERLWDLAALLPRQGVTSYLPTIISSSLPVVDRALVAINRRPPRFRGAHPLGLHLEGPMLSPGRRGAHSGERLRPATPATIEGWSRAAGVAMVTLAPELPGALEVIKTLCQRGVVVSAGHTDASTSEMLAGMDAGVTAVTHLFNAMTPFAPREPGPIGVALTDERLVAGVIVDGVHVHPLAVAAAWRALRPNRLAVVTDAVAAPNRARTPSRRLAGSVVPMDEAVRNLSAFTGCSITDAIACATSTPARTMGASRKGVVAPGYDADLVLLTPDLHIRATLVAGDVVAGDIAVEPAW